MPTATKPDTIARLKEDLSRAASTSVNQNLSYPISTLRAACVTALGLQRKTLYVTSDKIVDDVDRLARLAAIAEQSRDKQASLDAFRDLLNGCLAAMGLDSNGNIAS